MALSKIGYPFQARKPLYWVEASYGGGASGTTLQISKYVSDIKIGTGDKLQSIRGIESAVILETFETNTDPVISIEYNPQVGDTFLDDCTNRSSCCTLQSLAFEFGANICEGGDNDTFLYCVGFKAGSVKVAGSKKEPFTITVDMQGKSVASTAASRCSDGVLPADMAGALSLYNVAGSIAKSAGWNPGGKVAYIANSFDVSFDNQLTGYTDMGSKTKSYLVEGTLDVEGSVDISLDGAGGTHMAEVLALTSFDLTINFGGAGSLKLVLPGCKWKMSEISLNKGGEMMSESAPFICTPTDCDTSIVSTV